MTGTDVPPLGRRLAAEALGTGLLVTAVVGSGIAAARLSPTDTGLQLAENAAVTGAALAVIILLVGPVSGAHLNPLVSLADWWLGRARRAGLTLPEAGGYAAAHVAGGITGAVRRRVRPERAGRHVRPAGRLRRNTAASERLAGRGLPVLR